MNNKYLPSKQFIKRIIAIIIIIAIVLGVYELISYFKKKINTKDVIGPKIIVKDIVQKDSNANGIADWEEKLWGFNPEKNGPENKSAILAKKEEITKNNEVNGITTSNKAITANENLSREYFALIMSLKDSGNLNETSLKSAADAFGSEITPTLIPDVYTTKDQTIKTSNTKEDLTSYLKSLNNLLDKYKDLGTELSLVSQGVENSDPTALSLVDDISSSYITFSKEMIKIPVPSKISSTILSMANNYEKLGQATKGLAMGYDDPIVAMKSLINYQNYNEALLTDTTNLSSKI
jgi:hypothetical protein